jgi:glycerophosphoryl diester phosphodiesterase
MLSLPLASTNGAVEPMHPILRLVFFAFGAFGLLFSASIFVRGCADARIYESKSHPLLKQTLPLIALRGGPIENPENTFQGFDEAKKLGCWIHFDVRETRDNQLVVLRDATLDRTTSGSGYVREFTLEQIQKLSAGKGTSSPSLAIPDLVQMLDKYKDQVLVIEIQDNSAFVAAQVVDEITKRSLQDTVVIMSPHSAPVREVRKLRPAWITGSTPDEIERLSMASQVGLQGAISINSDFVISSLTKGNVQLLTPQVISEIHRRHKKVIAWTVNTAQDTDLALAFEIDGIATEAPKLLRGTITGKSK